MRNIYIIIFFLCAVFGLYASETKSIIIRYIGETDRIWEQIVINVGPEGYYREEWRIVTIIFYFSVQESFFLEIIDLIKNNEEVSKERKWDHEQNFHIGFELYVEFENQENYFYLMNRNSSLLFFDELIELIKTKENYEGLILSLENLIRPIR